MRSAFIFSALALVGCAETGPPKVAGGDKVASVTYYDFNGDGKPDYELHYRPLIKGVPGFEWTRKDTEYDGYYDTQTDYGATISISKDIHIRVPDIKFTDWPEPKRQ
jgi:hypothetical protein